MQAGRLHEVIPVCRNFNKVVYRNPLVVFFDSWPCEEFRVVKQSVPVTDGM
jgi:hypothetical protein